MPPQRLDIAQFVVTGFDEIPACLHPLASLVVTVPLALAFPALWGLAAVVVGLCAGRRYRITVDATGLELTLYAAWIVPVSRRLFPLTARVGAYEAWESNGPEGLLVATPEDPIGTDCFGPRFSAARIIEARDAANAALDRACAADA